MKLKRSEHKGQKDNSTCSKSCIINSDNDIVKARECARDIAEKIGFSTFERTLIATAVSEICRNIIEYATNGEISIEPVFNNNPKKGITITVNDNGPGIADIEKAMMDGYSTRRGMGVGLPGTKRIMDNFEIESEPGKGTRVIMSKWLTRE
jgi:serine/threonine-protein kinase RsbT